jgi:tRNA A-37 threonylcarbamoyl transferase component Bud32
VKFISKKNRVSLRDGLVYKQVKDPRAAELEAAILRELRGAGVAVPEVVSCRDNLLVLEYLPGEPLPDIVARGGYDPEALAVALCDWFAAFYAAVPPGELRGDVNGRNFLAGGGKIYSVDFEERRRGPIARDAGRLAAFLETYETCGRAKQIALSQAYMREFSERFHCAMDQILAEREAEFAAMRERRGAARDHGSSANIFPVTTSTGSVMPHSKTT